MLTILSITSGLNRRNPSLNVLAGAWILILAFSPESIRSIGFLLSFTAVYGIIAAKPLIRSTRVITNRPLNYLAQAIIISIMAQLATLPLTLIAFGSFPVYFLLSNLIAIPLASCILYLGFACLFLQFLPFIGVALIQLSYYGVELLIQFSALISKLPGATLSYRPQNYFSILLITIFTLFLLHITKLRRSQAIFLGQLSLTILLMTQIIERFDKTNHEKFNALLIKNKHELIIGTQKNNLQTDFITISRKLVQPIPANLTLKHFHYFVFHKYHVLYVDSHIVPEDLIDRRLANMIFIIDCPSTETLKSMISSERANFIFPVSTSDYHKYLNLGGEKEKIWPIWFTNKYSIDIG